MQIVLIISIMACGIFTGRILRHRNMQLVNRFVTPLIWLLLFLLGAEAGGNEDIVSQFSSLGAEAFVLTAAGMAGSILFSWLLWRYIGRSDKRVK